MRAEARTRARGDVADLLHRGLGVEGFARAATGALRGGVPFDGVCLVTFDPATGLPTGEFVRDGLPSAATPRLTEIEIGGQDVNAFADLARDRRTAASLSAATGGRLERSVRHRELRGPAGFGDELRAALVGQSGAWGALTLMRRAGGPHFTATDVEFVASVSGMLAEGLRRALLLTPVAGDVDDQDSGLLLLADDDSVELANPAARRWLAELDGDDPDGPLPVVIRAVAQRARTVGRDGTARARVRTTAGRWLLARGSLMGDGPGCRAAVVLDAARAPDLEPLVAEAYGLTERERRITWLVARGLPTSAIAGHLHLSAYTVQDHLKAIFDKTGVGTRGELVALLFLER